MGLYKMKSPHVTLKIQKKEHSFSKCTFPMKNPSFLAYLRPICFDASMANTKPSVLLGADGS